MYRKEAYLNHRRFHEQYEEIYEFLLEAADSGYNEHFHWGRFEWMVGHPLLDADRLHTITIFRDGSRKIVGLITYDTSFEDRAYVVHSCPDSQLLEAMVEHVIQTGQGDVMIKANAADYELCDVLKKKRFEKRGREESVLQLDLTRDLRERAPLNYEVSTPDFERDPWKYQLLLHRGFDHEGIPRMWREEFFRFSPHYNQALNVFALQGTEYCSHCGVWYTKGKTAYIEPVATIPSCRGKGMAKAVLYEAARRARSLGAERAVVLSEQIFYKQLGFQPSSEFDRWVKRQRRHPNEPRDDSAAAALRSTPDPM